MWAGVPHLNIRRWRMGLYLRIYIHYYFFVLRPSLVTGYKPALRARKHPILTILIDYKDFSLKGNAEHFVMFLVFCRYAESQLGHIFQKENSIFECMNPNYSVGRGNMAKISTQYCSICYKYYDIHLHWKKIYMMKIFNS